MDQGCLTTWIFEGGTFRVLRGHALPGPGSAQSAICSDGPSFEMGSFSTVAASDSLTLSYAYSSSQLGANNCRSRSGRMVRDCHSKLTLYWLPPEGDCRKMSQSVMFRSGTPSSVIQNSGGQADTAADVNSFDSFIASTSWMGSIALHTTNCSVNMQLKAVVAAQGIYSWEADIFNCHVLPDLALNELERRERQIPGVLPLAQTLRREFDTKAKQTTRQAMQTGKRDSEPLPESSNRYKFNETQHMVHDIVHVHMCFERYTANDMNINTRIPANATNGTTRDDSVTMLQRGEYTLCDDEQVPDTCHEKASCALSFGHVFRTADSPDPRFDLFMRNCLNRTDQGIIGVNVTNPDCILNVSTWNITAGCVCDRGYVGSGKCCEDRQVFTRAHRRERVDQYECRLFMISLAEATVSPG